MKLWHWMLIKLQSKISLVQKLLFRVAEADMKLFPAKRIPMDAMLLLQLARRYAKRLPSRNVEVDILLFQTRKMQMGAKLLQLALHVLPLISLDAEVDILLFQAKSL